MPKLVQLTSLLDTKSKKHLITTDQNEINDFLKKFSANGEAVVSGKESEYADLSETACITRTEGYIFQEPAPGTVELYRYVDIINQDYLYKVSDTIEKNPIDGRYIFDKQLGYIYPDDPGTSNVCKLFYAYIPQPINDHWLTTVNGDIYYAKLNNNAQDLGVVGYVLNGGT